MNKSLFFTSSYFYSLVFSLVLFLIPFPLVAQTTVDESENYDSLFLDNQFNDSNIEENSDSSSLEILKTTEESMEKEDDISDFNQINDSEEQKNLFFNFDNHLFYKVIDADNIYNPENKNYNIPLKDIIHANFLLNYGFFKQKFLFSFDFSSYLNIIKENEQNKVFVNHHVYINELSLLFNINRYFSFSIGKMRNKEGTGFLISPTDFFLSYPSIIETDAQSNARILGNYQLRLDFFLKNIDLSIAYLPLLKTSFAEFTRAYTDKNSYFGELWSKLFFRTGDFNTSIILYWNGYIQGGINLNWGIGDEIILHFDGAGALASVSDVVENGEYQLPLGIQGSLASIKRYRVNKEYKYKGQAVIGINYTPASILTLIFEVYINIGKENNHWKKNVNKLIDINNIIDQLKGTSFSSAIAEYVGVLGNSLSDHQPLKMQPVFLNLVVLRDNALSSFTTYIFNLSTQLIYSPLDTSFVWFNSIIWEAPVIGNFGFKTSLYFGKENSVFTSVPQSFMLQFFTQIKF